MKKILGVFDNPQTHWVGDGFPVRTLFSYHDMAQHTDPFLLLDFAGPRHFDPAGQPRGVGEHPHRGFETVTIVYQGEIAHRDSTGQGGVIGPGDVQWMTAASGILHEEFHSPTFTKTGGTLEMLQLWVNLPGKDKMHAPRYQSIVSRDIPVAALPEGAGDYAGHRGPARTFTPMDVWDMRLTAGKRASFTIPEGRTAILVMLHGTLQVNGSEIVRDGQMVLFERSGREIALEANNDVTVLLLSGEPLDEPVVGRGPFVMNTREEIRQAFDDFQSGRFGRIA